ncbi:MAG TPA: dihydroorotase [Candidatus Baltobacteraceae bacterium]|nr:dihydroorotase [Candidatus Baltobacteraceae bacterium]
MDPAQGVDAKLDVRTHAGVIVEIGEHLQPDGEEHVVDAQGAYVAPGFIDMHVHLREPGNPEKETVGTGSAAAVAGGFTAVAAMPNTRPAVDSVDQVRAMIVRAAQALARVYPIAAITRGREGREVLEYVPLAQAGAVAFSDDGNTVMDAGVLRAAALAARGVRGPFIVHCEDERVKDDSVMNEGPVSRKLGVRGAPAVAEDLIVARDMVLAADTGKHWHIAHVSTARSAQIITAARERGMNVTAEITPHHLVFTEDTVETLGAAAKVNPPLRTQRDVHELRQAVRRGEIDAFASDHAPHTEQEKTGDLSCAAVGFSGLEIAVGAYAYALPDLPLERFVAMLSLNPARILGIPGGSLRIGMPADITVFADRAWRVDSTRFYSKGKSTPFEGMVLPRAAIATIVSGRLVMHEGRILTGAHT